MSICTDVHTGPSVYICTGNNVLEVVDVWSDWQSGSNVISKSYSQPLSQTRYRQENSEFLDILISDYRGDTITVSDIGDNIEDKHVDHWPTEVIQK